MSKMLVVDGEQNIVNIFERFLIKQGYEVLVATAGKKALDLIMSNVKIDLMIVDLNMPEGNGVEVIKEGVKKNIPFILISGGIGIGKDIPIFIEELKLLNYDIKDLLYKPIDFNRFLEVIKIKLLCSDKKIQFCK